MKQLEIKTNRRLLIVELPNKDCEYGGLLKNRNLYFFTEKMNSKEDYPVCYPLPYDCEFICKGPELTEDIAKGFQHQNMRIAHNGEYLSAIEEFKFHISNHGYHWGDNPMGKKPELSDSRYAKEREFIENNPDEMVFGDHYADWSMWYESESRTFNPSKCIIFQIL